MIHGSPPELKFLPIARLSVDMAYQRSLESERSKALITRIAENFDWALFGAVMVAPLALDSFELMDGQHRVRGAERAGIDKVPATIIKAPTIEQRARIFRDANRQRVAVHAFSLYYADLKAGAPDAAALASLCALVDIEIPRYPIQQKQLKPNQCLSLVTLRKLALEKDALDQESQPARTLRILRAAFPDEPGGLRSHLIMGLREWVRLHPSCDVVATAAALQRYSLERLEKQVFSIGLGGARRSEAVEKVLRTAIPYAAAGKRVDEDALVAPPKPAGPPPPPAPVRKVASAPAFNPSKLTARPVEAQPLKVRR